MKVGKTFFAVVTFAAALPVALLAACGGGGSDKDPAPSQRNVFASMQGSYAVACKGWRSQTSATTYVDESNQYIVTVAELVGTDRANISIRATGYESLASDVSNIPCDPTKLTTDVTVTGQMRDLGKTRMYQGTNNMPVTAKLVELTYYSFTLTKGSLSGATIPLPNATTQMGYVLDGNKLYVTQGFRGVDVPGVRLSARFGVKQ